MSLSFSFILNAPFQDPARVVYCLDNEFTDIGARIDSRLYQAAFDSPRGVMDVPLTQPGHDFEDFYDNMLLTKAWQGAYISYRLEGVSFHLLVAGLNKEFTNIFMEIDYRGLSRLYQTGKGDVFSQALEATAGAGRAEAGFGRLELPYRPASRDQALNNIRRDPDQPLIPCSVGFIGLDVLTRDEIKATYGSAFVISEFPSGNWLLEERDWLEDLSTQE